MLLFWLGIGGSIDPRAGEGTVGADSSCGNVSELLAADGAGAGAGAGTGGEDLRGSGGRGGTSGTGADAASGGCWISV